MNSPIWFTNDCFSVGNIKLFGKNLKIFAKVPPKTYPFSKYPVSLLPLFYKKPCFFIQKHKKQPPALVVTQEYVGSKYLTCEEEKKRKHTSFAIERSKQLFVLTKKYQKLYTTFGKWYLIWISSIVGKIGTLTPSSKISFLWWEGLGKEVFWVFFQINFSPLESYFLLNEKQLVRQIVGQKPAFLAKIHKTMPALRWRTRHPPLNLVETQV